jgi:hypothetical protein
LFEFNPSLPLLDPPLAPSSLQPPGDTCTEASGCFVDNILLDRHAQTPQTTDQNNDKDSGDALEGDAVNTANPIDHETDDFWNREDAAMEGDVDPCEGIVSDWDLLAKEFIVEAEELSKFECSLLHTHDSLAFLCSGEFSILDRDLNILCLFGMKIRNNLTASTFCEMLYNFSCHIIFPRQAWRISPRPGPMFRLSPALTL